MLTYVTNDQKTFEERMAEAIADIPLYTDEWTNFNPSDPGMTILETVLGFCRELGFTLLHLTFSPVKGPEGNIEFLAHLTKKPGAELRPDLADLVRQAHETLNPREENP